MSNPQANTQLPTAPNPKLWKDPDTIRFKDMYKHVGVEEIRLNQTFRNFKSSLMYLGTIFNI